MNYDLIKKIDFGEIDGYGDPNLEKYFLDNGYWEKIINDKIFFVVGKKGTGKSSIYQMIEKEAFSKGCIVINKDFGEFPFERLLKLTDDNFAKPNQYQTIWKNVILGAYAGTEPKYYGYRNRIITSLRSDPQNKEYLEVSKQLRQCETLGWTHLLGSNPNGEINKFWIEYNK